MGVKACCFGSLTGSVVGAGIFGGLGAGLGAASGAAGAAILSAAGNAGYVVAEATTMGAVGGAILNGPFGALYGCTAGALAANGFFGENNKEEGTTKAQTNCSIVGYVGSMTLGGLIGWGVLNSGNLATAMDLGRTAAALAVGGAVTAIPASYAIMCMAIPLVMSAAACAMALDQSNKEEMQASRLLHV